MRLIAGLIALPSSPPDAATAARRPPPARAGPPSSRCRRRQGCPPSFVAFGIEKGMFDKQKLDIELSPTQGGAATIPALVSGEIQVGGSNVVSLLLAALQGPADPRDRARHRRAAGGLEGLRRARRRQGLGRQEAKPTSSGKTIAVNTLNNVAEVVVKASLEKQGVDPESMKLVRGAVPGDGRRRWSKGSVDAAFSDRAVRDPDRRGGRQGRSTTPTSRPSRRCRSAPTR